MTAYLGDSWNALEFEGANSPHFDWHPLCGEGLSFTESWRPDWPLLSTFTAWEKHCN